MNAKKVFCEECRNDVNYTVKIVPMVSTLVGKEYSYTGREAYCAECGSEIFVSEIIDANLNALYDAYHQANGIVPLD